ncbi:hypothetical protein H8B02_34790 [Bradyrhizobium sp. Pear77]|uniref:hypothetical protein n=1 Tax=Bradyrhizobium altum TaxID=1571202 RepID=UPI001E47D2AF|nr:hypothetical protein [Bradyrhizobium altum]MCC8958405.1 hypothetical protein [Bradyrhizobium altum]
MLLAAIVYALYGLLLKRWNLPISGWQSTYMQALCALAVMFPAFLATPAPLRQVNAETLPLIVYAGADGRSRHRDAGRAGQAIRCHRRRPRTARRRLRAGLSVAAEDRARCAISRKPQIGDLAVLIACERLR